MMKITLHNQTPFRVDGDHLKRFCSDLLKRIEYAPSDELSLAMVDDREMRRLNEEYYGGEGTTDVLAFPYDTDAEIVLNPYEYRRRAEGNPSSLNEEFVKNLIHALLHLAGYDHTNPADQGAHVRRQGIVMEQMKQQGIPTLIEGEGDGSTSAHHR